MALMYTALQAVLLLGSAALLRLVLRVYTDPLRKLRSPPRKSVLQGHLGAFQMDKIHLWMLKWSREFNGEPWTFRMAHQRFLVTCRPEKWREVAVLRPEGPLRQPAGLHRVAAELKLWGVVSTEGERWRVHRRVTAPAFTRLHVRSMEDAVNTVGARLRNKWLGATANGPADLDVYKDFMLATFDVINLVGWTTGTNAVETACPLADSVNAMFALIADRVFNPVPTPLKKLIFRKREARFHAATEHVRQWAQEVAQKRREERAAAGKPVTQRPGGARDLLDAMLDTLDGDSERYSSFTDDDLIGNMETFLSGGMETTANTLSWTMLLLAQHPKLLNRLHEEVDAVMGSAGDEVSAPVVERLRFTEACVKEAMRIKPVVPQHGGDIEYPAVVDGVAVLGGTPVIEDALYSQRTRYENGDAYVPDRWLTGSTVPGKNARIDQTDGVSQVFGTGQRMCPGRFLARHEAVGLLAHLARRLTWSLAPGFETVEEVCELTLGPKGGAVLRVSARKNE